MTESISPLEQEVMDIVWEMKECSIRSVLEKISQDKKLAYTTVATLLQRLFEKGLVNRISYDTVLYFSPKVSKQMYSKRMAKSFIQTFMSSFGDAAITSFAESIETLPKEKKDYFLKLLEKYNENK